MEEFLATTDEQAKALQEAAKTANTALEVSQGIVDFLSRVVVDPTEQVAGLLGDKLRYFRVSHAISCAEKLSRKLNEADQSVLTKKIPLNVICPILDQLTLEDEDDAQELWVNLIVNAADSSCETEVTKSIVGILRELGSVEARCLNTIVQSDSSYGLYRGAPIYGLPDKIQNRTFDDCPAVPEYVLIALQNLIRLGCLEVCHLEGMPSMAEAGVQPTVIGKALVRVCTRT